ncbi:MAG: hypothetical protein CMF25_04895 [Kangiellaceae bacterium]|jgi:hypothetical protein|nr:hypothetical protein [Kangiellaceae bacterium]|tara:strand:+ start:8458 stop:8814 length:357 start_codon:yes stop_codon:yes gene_type:complete
MKLEQPSSTQQTTSNFIDSLSIAILCVLLGVVWLFPEWQYAEGSWLLAIGAALVFNGVAKYLAKIASSLWAFVLGCCAILYYVQHHLEFEIKVLPTALIVIGSVIIVEQLYRFFRTRK